MYTEDGLCEYPTRLGRKTAHQDRGVADAGRSDCLDAHREVSMGLMQSMGDWFAARLQVAGTVMRAFGTLVVHLVPAVVTSLSACSPHT